MNNFLLISETTQKEMLDRNPNIKFLKEDEINRKIDILKNLNCDSNQIVNIISSNPNYLTLRNDKIINLIKYLTKIGFKTLNILFDSNPYILNLEEFEVEYYIDEKVKDGIELSDIIDILESNPYLFINI